MDYHYNKGIRSFGERVVVKIIEDVSNYYDNIHFISIGSGLGGIEYKSKELYEYIKWICIEPSPSSYHNNKNLIPLIKPHYNYVSDLIKDKPDIVENCILFLNWCEPNKSRYDYDAIIDLKPLGILSIYELFENGNGCAGGELFYNHLIRDCNDYNIKRSLHLLPYIETKIDNDDNYDDEELMDIRITWFDNKKNIKKDNEENNIIEYHSEYKHMTNCSLM
jgi:hypothetical protein